MKTKEKTKKDDWETLLNQKRHMEEIVEKLITGKNKHSVYRLCQKHGLGCYMPFEKNCPDCKVGRDVMKYKDENTTLYISGEDIYEIIRTQIALAFQEGRESEKKTAIKELGRFYLDRSQKEYGKKYGMKIDVISSLTQRKGI